MDRKDWLAAIEKLPWQAMLARSPQWLSLLLVVLIAQAAADMTWLVFTPAEDHKLSLDSGAGSVSPTSLVRLTNVVNLHMFGEAQTSETPVADAPIDAPKTNLKLVLRGVFSDSDLDEAKTWILEGMPGATT